MIGFCLLASSLSSALPAASACSSSIGDPRIVWVTGNCASPTVYVLGEPVPYLVPCLALKVSVERPSAMGGGTLEEDVPPAKGVCDPNTAHAMNIRFQWRATAFGGSGRATFSLDTTDLAQPDLNVSSREARPYAVSLLTRLLERHERRLVEARVQVLSSTSASGSLPIPRTVVTVAFDVTWGDDCASAQGRVSASVDDRSLPTIEAPSLLQRLCLLSQASDAAALVLAATSGVAQIAERLADDVPPLRAVAGSLVPPPLPDAAPPAPTDDLVESAASGNATVALFDAERLVSEEHDLLLQTPVGNLGESGSAGIPSPLAAPPASPAPPAIGSPGADAPATRALPPAAPSPAPSVAPPRDAARPAQSVGPPPGEAGVRVEHVGVPVDPSLPLARAALAIAVGGTLLGVALALYQRITKPAALRHEGRAALMRACQALQRGATATELAHASGMLRKTAEYHLRYLARMGYLRVDEEPYGPPRFAGHSAPRAPRAEGAARAASLDDAVLERICAEPGVTAAQIGRDLGVARRRVDRRVKDLVLAGLVTRRSEEGVRLYPESSA